MARPGTRYWRRTRKCARPRRPQARRIAQGQGRRRPRQMRQIAAAIGYARMMQQGGKAEEVDRALTLLAEDGQRARPPRRADRNFIRGSSGAHSARSRAGVYTTSPRDGRDAPGVRAPGAGSDNVRPDARSACTRPPLTRRAWAGGENYTPRRGSRGHCVRARRHRAGRPPELRQKLDQPGAGPTILQEKLNARCSAPTAQDAEVGALQNSP